MTIHTENSDRSNNDDTDNDVDNITFIIISIIFIHLYHYPFGAKETNHSSCLLWWHSATPPRCLFKSCLQTLSEF